MIINDLHDGDADEYTCRATNSKGTRSTRAQLKIKTKPRVFIPPKYHGGYEAQKVREREEKRGREREKRETERERERERERARTNLLCIANPLVILDGALEHAHIVHQARQGTLNDC